MGLFHGWLLMFFFPLLPGSFSFGLSSAAFPKRAAVFFFVFLNIFVCVCALAFINFRRMAG